ncbi:MAG: hypothetical protein DRJ42_26315 [Deltaproteobacteria bacterium]|nr:MAG: hypothetical protein DRJ42_26315 [Deltaproteobacteria bacterium]
MTRIVFAAGLVAASVLLAGPAAAFCGFYVAGAESDLYADATMVVMMREGTTTVLSMQNDYRGPVENFAMVVPVPVVLAEENVKTLDKEIFARVDRLAAPRLVEYWEQDPCAVGADGFGTIGFARGGGMRSPSRPRRAAGRLQVQVEAEFAVGEYEIVILSAQDAGDLETWLRQNGYSIPDGAAAALAPYVQSGMKFFVAKVDVTKVTFDDGRALLSPLRVHYDSDEFSLPIRLGMLNSSGTQDLIVHVLARNQRFEAASYENVNIPTNLEVVDGVRESFGGFYAALFDKTIEEHEGAVVTEYAWQATGCDPCPGPVLSEQDLLSLGADVVPGLRGPSTIIPRVPLPRPRRGGRFNSSPFQSFVLTRLHYRYGRGELGADLVLRPASPIQGGRGVGPAGELPTEARESGANNFQGRYIIRHPWEGEISCDEPHRGRWGGPPPDKQRDGASGTPRAATNLGTQARGGVQLVALLKQPLPALGLTEVGPAPVPEPPAPVQQPAQEPAASVETVAVDGGCGCRASPGRPPSLPLAAGLLVLWAATRRNRR